MDEERTESLSLRFAWTIGSLVGCVCWIRGNHSPLIIIVLRVWTRNHLASLWSAEIRVVTPEYFSQPVSSNSQFSSAIGLCHHRSLAARNSTDLDKIYDSAWIVKHEYCFGNDMNQYQLISMWWFCSEITWYNSVQFCYSLYTQSNNQNRNDAQAGSADVPSAIGLRISYRSGALHFVHKHDL